MPTPSGQVAVVGSANLDIVIRLERFPAAGETVLGQHVDEVAGGKGLNQAIAAAHHGPCAFVAAVGDDEAGRLLVARLERDGVDATWVTQVPEPTGRAFIEVTPDGENRIVVTPLANGWLEADAVRDALDALEPSLVLAQLEIPRETVAAAAAWTTARGARFVLNASPVDTLPPALLARCDPLIVNRAEAIAILDHQNVPHGPDAPIGELAGRLAEQVGSVVVTDGPRGAHVGTAGRVRLVPAEPVSPVDTTGAGDSFAGTLASALADGLSLGAAAERANAAAAQLVQLPRGER